MKLSTNMRRCRILFGTVLATSICLFGTASDAAIMVSFDASSYSAMPGRTVDVGVLLTVTDADTSLLESGGTNGLLTFGIALNYDTMPDSAAVAAPADIEINLDQFLDFGGFDSFRINDPGSAQVLGIAIDQIQGVQVGVGDPLTVRLATFRFTLSANLDAITLLSLGDLSGGDDFLDVTLGPAYDSEIVFSSSVQITATAIPEPSGGCLWAAATAVFYFRRRLHRS